MIVELQYIIAFSIFVVLQSIAINGIYESMRQGNLLYPFKNWLSKYVSNHWMKPLGDCIRCMSTVYGGITFWGTVLPVFGFCYFEIWVFIIDVFILCSLNYYFYKKL